MAKTASEIREIETVGAERVASGHNAVRFYEPITRSTESIEALERGGEKMAGMLHQQQLNQIARDASK